MRVVGDRSILDQLDLFLSFSPGASLLSPRFPMICTPYGVQVDWIDQSENYLRETHGVFTTLNGQPAGFGRPPNKTSSENVSIVPVASGWFYWGLASSF